MPFLSALTATLIAMMLAYSACASELPTQEEAAQETYIPEIRLLEPQDWLTEKGIAMAYVDQDTQPGNGKYACGALQEPRLSQAAAEVVSAFQHLPEHSWKGIGLKYVLLCSETKAGGRDIGGIPVPPLQLLMLAAGEPGSRLPYTALHELYHLIELQSGSYTDHEWESAYQGYDNGYGRMAGRTEPGSGGPGFINGYGKSYPHEERAEIFTLLHHESQQLVDYIAKTSDQILLAKIIYMQKKCRRLLGERGC